MQAVRLPIGKTAIGIADSCIHLKERVLSFADPQSVTINAVANSLPRTSTRDTAGTFTKDDGTVKLSVSHTSGKRIRRTARLDHQKVAPDPLFPAQNSAYSMSFYVVADVPLTGYTVTEQKQIVDALVAWLSASSGANTTRLLGGEN